MNIEMLKGILLLSAIFVWFGIVGYYCGDEARSYRERKRREKEDDNGMD